jgi:hypothetical protein
MTIRYNGRDYSVEVTDNPKVPYRLHGSRGACYSAFRNHQKPHLLFLVATGRMKVLDGWLTDEGDVLRQCA